MNTTHRGKLSRTSINLRFLCASGAALVMSSSFTPASANDFMSQPVAVKDSLSKPPVVDAPMTLRTALNEAPPELVASNGKTAAVLAKKGETAFAAKKYLDAASFFNLAAVAIAHDKGSTQPRIGYLQMEAEALFRHGKSFPDNAALDKSIERFTLLLAMINKDKAPREWAATQSDFGRALVVSGARFGDHPKIDRGIDAIRASLDVRTFETSAQEWASSQIDLAEALIAGGRISATNGKLEEAVQICQEVVDKKSEAGIRSIQYIARSVMANALQQLGQEERDAVTLLGAASLAKDALSAIKRTEQPYEWARAMNYLANSNREMADLQNDASLSLLAVEQYGQSLEVRNRRDYPMEWAQTQLDLGNAYLNLAYLQNDQSMAERSMGAYSMSLEVRTETATPLEWGMSRNNYGAALNWLSKARPEATVSDFLTKLAAYRDGARVTARERAPRNWAMMQVNIGLALVEVWNKKQMELPRQWQTDMDALMQNQIKNQRVDDLEEHNAALAMIVKRQESVDELEEAIVAFRESLKVYTKEANLRRWLNTQYEIAQALQKIGNKLQQPQRHEEAISIFREQQTVLQRQYAPAQWAGIQNNIASAVDSIATITQDPEKFREAAVVYAEAIAAVPDNQPFSSMYMKKNLADLKCHLGRIDTDKKALQESVDLFQELKQLSLLSGDTSRTSEYDGSIAECTALITNMSDGRLPN
jgi:tetratricopeptide (TPR) repeat protein